LLNIVVRCGNRITEAKEELTGTTGDLRPLAEYTQAKRNGKI
jgi:hypothetical protein